MGSGKAVPRKSQNVGSAAEEANVQLRAACVLFSLCLLWDPVTTVEEQVITRDILGYSERTANQQAR